MRHIYNTTFLLPEEKELVFVETIKGKILPRFTKRGIVVEPLFTRVFVEEQDGAGFSLQLIFPDEQEYHQFMENHREQFFNELHALMGNDLLHFSSLLKEVS